MVRKTPSRSQALAFVVVLALMYGSFHFHWVVPIQERIALRQGEIDGLRVEIALALAITNRLPEFEAEVADLEARLETLRTVSPSRARVRQVASDNGRFCEV